MASIDWPSSTLPTTFQQSGFSYSEMSGVLRTNMDTGPQKVRRRFTSTPIYYSGTMIMTQDQVDDFLTFYRTTTAYGSLRFNFLNQLDQVNTVEARFKIDTGGEPFRIIPDGDTNEYQVSFTLEVF